MRELLAIQGAQLWAHGELPLNADDSHFDDDAELDARLQRDPPRPPLDLEQVR